MNARLLLILTLVLGNLTLSGLAHADQPVPSPVPTPPTASAPAPLQLAWQRVGSPTRQEA